MIEKIYYSDSEYVTFDLPDDGRFGCFMSGGADSSLMCFLMAHIIKKNNLNTKIYPITTEFLHRPYNLRCAYDVVEKVSELTGFEFSHHLCFILPNHKTPVSDDEKIVIMGNYTREYSKRFDLHAIYNGLTANPPIDFVPNSLYANRQTCRDDLEWRQEQEAKKGLKVPFIHIDKKVIGKLYNKFNLIDSLLPLTRSCEAENKETEFFTKDCFEVREKGQECWWCLERDYGFSEFIKKT